MLLGRKYGIHPIPLRPSSDIILTLLNNLIKIKRKLPREKAMEPVSITGALSPWEPGFLSLAIYIFLVLVLVGIFLLLASWLGEKKTSPEKLRPYESGIIPTGSARFRYPVPFYLVATFFLIFDVEAVYIFSWAIAFDQLGWNGWLQISFFILILLISLFYIWRKGGLEWGPRTQKNPDTPETSS
jgi:NADH-quinone oxidoreductase subunit A